MAGPKFLGQKPDRYFTAFRELVAAGELEANWPDFSLRSAGAGRLGFGIADALSQVCATVVGSCFYAATRFDPLLANHYAEVTIGDVDPANACGVGPAVRVGAAATGECYAASYHGSWRIYRIDASGTLHQIVNHVGPAPIRGERIRLEVEGTALRLFINGEQVAASTDATLAAGAPGLAVATVVGQPVNRNSITNFRCGEVA